MSKIVVLIDQNDIPASVSVALQKVTINSLSNIRQAVKYHTPVADYNLFYNDHDEVTARLKAVTELLNRNDITYSLYEVDENTVLKDYEDLNIDAIDYDTLINILDSHGKN